MAERLTSIEQEIIRENELAFSAGSTGRRADCPEDVAIRAYHFGYMPFLSRIRTSWHVHSCVYCFARTVALDTEAEYPEAPLRSIRAKVLNELSKETKEVRSWWKSPALYGAAASLAIVAISAGLLTRGPSQHAPVFRGIETTLPAQVDRAAGAPIVIRWKPISSAAYYTVDVYEANLDGILFRTRLDATKYVLSEQEMGSLVDGRRYYCRIEAMSDLNDRLAMTRGLSFSYAPSLSGILATSD